MSGVKTFVHQSQKEKQIQLLTPHIAHRLDQVNQRFYDQIADDFHQSRKHGWREWRALIDLLVTR